MEFEIVFSFFFKSISIKNIIYKTSDINQLTLLHKLLMLWSKSKMVHVNAKYHDDPTPF